MRGLKWGCGVFAALVLMPAQAAIHKCREGDRLVFRDTPCSVPYQAEQRTPAETAPLAEATVAMPAEDLPLDEPAVDEPVVYEPATEAAAAVEALAVPREAPEPVKVARAESPATSAIVMSPATITLPNGKAVLKLSEAFRYLDPAEARSVLVDTWGNPPEAVEDVLGMIAPAGMDFAADESWGVVITYTDDGHVSDEDAAEIDYADLLEDMQADTEAGNEELADQGYPPITLVGWAEPPHYDGASRKIYWAKDLVFGDGDVHTLNYSIRVLGREGVLELNAVAGLDQLASIRGSMQQIVGFADFTEGNRYQDFNESTDRMATYGIAALVAGGLAAKKGLFAVIGVLLLKFWKLLLIAFLATGGAVGRLLGKRR